MEKLQKAQLENRDLRERLLELVNQYKIVAEDENKASVEKQKIYDEYVFTQLATATGACLAVQVVMCPSKLILVFNSVDMILLIQSSRGTLLICLYSAKKCFSHLDHLKSIKLKCIINTCKSDLENNNYCVRLSSELYYLPLLNTDSAHVFPFLVRSLVTYSDFRKY